MTLKNRLAGLEQRVRATRKPFEVFFLSPGETFETKFGRPREADDFVVAFVVPDGFDATKPAQE